MVKFVTDDPTNQVDSLGRKQGHWVTTFDSSGVPYTINSYQVNDTVTGDWIMKKNGQEIEVRGYWMGIIHTKIEYSKYDCISKRTSFNQTGGVKHVSNYKNCKEHGLDTIFSKDGSIESTATFRKGTVNGEYKRYFVDGNVSMSGLVRENKGSLKRIVFNYFVNSSKVQATLRCGTGRDRRPYRGFWFGEWSFYSSDGNLKRTAHYRHGRYHGNVIKYNKGTVVSNTKYKYGTRHGLSFDYGTNGILVEKTTYQYGEVIERHQFYKDGKTKQIERFKVLDPKDRWGKEVVKHGTQLHISLDGIITLSEEYDEGVLLED